MKEFPAYLFLLITCFSVCIFFAEPASAQQKYFKITDNGQHYFFNDATIRQNKVVSGANTYVRPITPRTFFLEAKNARLFPESIAFTDFQNMTIAEKQALLDSLQDFNWTKYQIADSAQTGEVTQSELAADTLFSIHNLAFNKESTTLYGDLVSGAGRMQKFMIYPNIAKEKGSITWVFEWIEPDLFLKKRGYVNLDLPEQKIYQALLQKGIELNTLNELLE